MFKLGALIWIMLGTFLAGVCVITIVSVPSLEAQSRTLIPICVAASALIAIPLAHLISKSIQKTVGA